MAKKVPQLDVRDILIPDPPLEARLFSGVDEPEEAAQPIALEGPRTAPGMPHELVFLEILRGPGAGTILPVTEGEHAIGRAPESWLLLKHESVSRDHAILLRREDRFFLRDAMSQNGTFLGGERVTGMVEVPFGREMRLGESVAVLRAGPVGVGLTAPLAVTRRGSLALLVGIALLVLLAAAAAVWFLVLRR